MNDRTLLMTRSDRELYVRGVKHGLLVAGSIMLLQTAGFLTILFSTGAW